MLEYLLIAIFIGLDAFILTKSIKDKKQKRVLKRYPFISFIMPTFKDSHLIKKTIKSIIDSYKGKYEIIIINDCSTDKTKQVLEKLSKLYRFKRIDNTKNLGKVASVNKAAKLAKGEILFIVDTDVILNKESVDDMLARLESKKVAAATCHYKPIESSLLSKMQEMEYSLQTVLNNNAKIAVIGGCFAVKRSLFEKVGGLSEESITEDLDLGLKLQKEGFEIEQSMNRVGTYPPNNIKTLVKQELRWSSGTPQATYKHMDFISKRPFSKMLLVSFLVLAGLLYASIAPLDPKCMLGVCSLPGITPLLILLPLIFIPYVIFTDDLKENLKRPYFILAIILFAYIYFPFMMVMSVIGIVNGSFMYFKLKKGGTGWQGED